MSQELIAIISAAIVAVALAAPVHAQVDCADWTTWEFFEEAEVSDVTRCLQEGANLEGRNNRNGFTPLFFAARGGTVEAVTVLLEAGADPRARDSGGTTPLHHAKTAEVVEALLET